MVLVNSDDSEVVGVGTLGRCRQELRSGPDSVGRPWTDHEPLGLVACM